MDCLFHSQFRYATSFDYILMFISIAFAILNGAALPGSMYVFGDLTNLYVNYDASLQIFSDVSSTLTTEFSNIAFNESGSLTSIEEGVNNSIITPNLFMFEDNLTEFLTLHENISFGSDRASNVSCVVFSFANDQRTSVYLVLLGLVNNTYTISPTDGGCDCLESIFESFNSESRCLTDETFIHGERTGDGILWTIYFFLMIAAAVFIASYVQIAFMLVACERQVQKMRLLYYRSVLRQDIAWFDLNPSGEVSSRLNE